MYPSSAGAATAIDAAASISTSMKLIRRSVMVDGPFASTIAVKTIGERPEEKREREGPSGGSVRAEPGHPFERRDHGREVVAAAPGGDRGRAELLREARERQRHAEPLPFLEHEPEILQ